MSTTVQIDKKTLQMLNRLKEKMGTKSYDELIRMLMFEREGIPRSMFGSNTTLKPFSSEDEAELHEL